ncbi:MAG: response regulator [Candidatus Riflebacteria bacterium]|nr:response regulator [Candidatus Riflebacteria bacterium]
MPAETIRILLADDKIELRQNIKRLLSFEESIEVVGEASNGQEAIDVAKICRPDLLIMDINMPVIDGITATEIVNSELPSVSVILTSVQGDQEFIRRAMKAGARDFLIKPFSNDELIDTIKSVFKSDQRKRQLYQAPTSGAAGDTGVGRVKGGKKEGQVVTLFATKGGVGKTTVLLNLAVTLSRYGGHKVAVVDFDLQFGDIAIMLNLIPSRNIISLLEEPPPWTSSVVLDYMIPHEQSGVEVLLAPSRPEYAEIVQVEHIEQTLLLLREQYDYVLVDTSSMFRNIELSILDASQTILVITTLELSAIKDMKLCLDLLQNLNYSPDKIKLVLNRGKPNVGGITYEDVQSGLKKEISALIPTEGRVCIEAINKGTPFMLNDTSSELAQSFIKLAEIIVGQKIQPGDAAGAKPSGGLFDRFSSIFSGQGGR